MSDSVRPSASAPVPAGATEPAIPLVTPLVPMQAIRDLFKIAEMDFGGLERPGVRVWFDVSEKKDAKLAAVVSVRDVDIAGTVTREYEGRWSGGVFVQWTPGRQR